ncbi:MAG: ABC transporter substrate-binding protein, partial [Leptospiraceae bacterium]|nr:ABC transporter substrate-binding protein [Leptospiraceae bacterium]
TKSNYNIIQNIEKINDKDIIINFSSSKEELLDLLSTVSSSIYYEDSHKKGEFKSEGKFKLEKWVRNNFMILTENLNLPAIPPRIQLKFLQNSATAIFLFSRNELDLLKLPYHIASHPSLKDGKLNFVKGKSVQYVAINNTDECFDVHFRRAVNFGIDRKKIIEKVFDSFAEEVYFPFPERYLHKNISRDKYKLYFNLEKAKNELQRSRCYPYILNRELDFRMRGDDENKAKGLAITQNLRDIGLKVKINPMEKAPLYKENGQKKGDLTLLTWYIDFDSALNFIDPLFSSDSYGNGGNRSFYKNKAMDEIISKGRINYNLTEDLQIRSLDLLKKDYPWIFLWSIYEIYLVSPRLSENYQIEDLFF